MEFIKAKTIVTRTKSTDWFGAEYNMNIYKGCCHGCIYCDSRSECYHVDNFDEVRAKEDALRIIRNDLKSKIKKGVISTGAMSDPYNPFEEKCQLTRHALELIDAYEFGVAIATKSPLITRDIDILSDIKKHSPVIAKITVTSADDDLCRKIEPRVAVTSQRMEAIKKLCDSGIFTGILMMPILPFLEDNEENIGSIIKMAAESGARFIYPALGVTLRQNQRDYYYQRLDELFPGLKDKYIKKYQYSYSCSSPKAKKLWGFFTEECKKTGILYKMQDIIKASKLGYGNRQMSFFESNL